MLIMFKIYTLFMVIIVNLAACIPAKNNQTTYTVPQCLKSQSQCVVQTKYGKVEVLFNRDNVLTETPFNIYLKLDKLDKLEEKNVIKAPSNKATDAKLNYKIAQIKSYMEGKEMFMGKIPVFFAPSAQDNILVAQTLLGSCAKEQMVWRLWFTVFFEKINASTAEIQDKKSYQDTFFIDFTSNRL
jgi:hypothetical protein